MKIAIFHNYLDNIGGAEIVGLTLARHLNADIYTTNIDKEKIAKMGFSDVLPRIKSIGKVPLFAPFKQQLALIRFRLLNLKNKYDLYIIDGDWAMSGAVNNHPNIWYVHSPIREIWDSYQYARKNIVPWYFRNIFDIWVKINRILNKSYCKKVNSFVCNSKNTQNRIKRFLGYTAKIINPPIETNKIKPGKNKDYWLSVNRLLAPKKVELQLKAFQNLPKEKLIIVGSYEKSKQFTEYVNYIKKIKPKNVEIKSWVSSEELIKLYSNCKGFITTAIDEDFGMTPVEAMSAGKPVIAGNEGGYKETIINGKTGILIDNINSDKIVSTIKEINSQLKKNPNKYKNACIHRAKEFDTLEFIKKIKTEINRLTNVMP